MLNKVFWQRVCFWFWVVVLVFLFFVNVMQVVYGRVYDYERQTLLARERRFGKETDEFRPVGGKAEITASAIFENGVHLESFEKNAMAVAIYQFEEIDKNASSLAVQIAYRGTGKVFVSKDKDSGITFELPADRERQTLYLAANYIADDGVEIHVIADSNKKLDIQFIELESLRYKPEIRIIERYEYLPPEYPRTIYYYYYRGPIYSVIRPYEYVVYDSWWDSGWYIGWRATFQVRTYPVYRYHWRPDRIVHVHHYYDQPEATVVRELPRSREQVQYNETQRRRPEASRSRLDMPETRRIQKQRAESGPRSTENSERVQIRYRPDSSAQWQTPSLSRSLSSETIRIKQRREAPRAAPAQKETSSRTVIKQRRVESASSSAPTKTSDDEEEQNRKKRRR